MNTLVATIKFDQTPEIGDDLSAKIYSRQDDDMPLPRFAVSLFCNDALTQCLDNFVSYQAACAFAFDWLRCGFEE